MRQSSHEHAKQMCECAQYCRACLEKLAARSVKRPDHSHKDQDQKTRPSAGIVESSLKSRRVAVTDHVLAWCKKLKSPRSNGTPARVTRCSARWGKVLPLWHRPLARR